jgi:hypothetical protein
VDTTKSDKQLPQLSALERERIMSVKEAAEFESLSESTFRRRKSHLIRDLSPRRQGVRTGDLVDDRKRK